MAKKSSEEALIRDFLAENIGRLPDLIQNLSTIRADLKAEDERFKALTADLGGPTALDLIRRLLTKRDLRGLESLHSLEMIGAEFPLLHTGKGGFQPSADILARCAEDSRLFLIEVKQLMQTEREALTELSAYSHGLHGRFWNLAAADQVWVPICTEWRTTVRAAFANEAIWQHRSVLPMSCSVRKNAAGTISDVRLQLFSLLETVDESTAMAQFAWDCFDTITFELHQESSDPRTLVEFISSTAARFGFSGCVLYGESVAGTAFPYPYLYAVAIQNPITASLKARQLEVVLADTDHGGVAEMRRQVKKGIWDWLDLDFSSMKTRETPDILKEIADQLEASGMVQEAREMRLQAEEGYISVQEMAQASRSRSHALFEEIKSRLELFCSFTMGAPSLKGLFQQGVPVVIDHVSYFGLMQEAVYERLYWEILHATRGDGPIIGDVGRGPVDAIASPSFFFDFMELMNFEHACQDET
jgi:hypothetical protein